MVDITIKTISNIAIIRGETPEGKRWILDNVNGDAVVTHTIGADLAKEFAEDIVRSPDGKDLIVEIK